MALYKSIYLVTYNNRYTTVNEVKHVVYVSSVLVHDTCSRRLSIH